MCVRWSGDTPDRMNVIEVDRLHKRYGDTVAVDDVSFAVQEVLAMQPQESRLPDKLELRDALDLDPLLLQRAGRRRRARRRPRARRPAAHALRGAVRW